VLCVAVAEEKKKQEEEDKKLNKEIVNMKFTQTGIATRSAFTAAYSSQFSCPSTNTESQIQIDEAQQAMVMECSGECLWQQDLVVDPGCGFVITAEVASKGEPGAWSVGLYVGVSTYFQLFCLLF
jgi:hypothetical protein